jgi:glyoxylase-like metal-dependent hydrolase (beta-lactamase superfamily II)
MKTITITTDILKSKTYIIILQNSAILIDPSGTQKTYDKIQSVLKEENKPLSAVFFTHGHFDHIALGHKYKGIAPIYIHKNDNHMLYTDSNFGAFFGYDIKPFEADNNLNGKEEIMIDGIKIKVLHTPGHSQGSVCYIIENCIFSGDTLFKNSIGRTDLDGGSSLDMKKSLNALFSLSEDYIVYPGHGAPTTLRYEQDNNPYIKI